MARRPGISRQVRVRHGEGLITADVRLYWDTREPASREAAADLLRNLVGLILAEMK